MTYKLITEQELQQAIDVLLRRRDGITQYDAITTLRAVMERPGPKLFANHYKCDGTAHSPIPLYTLPEPTP